MLIIKVPFFVSLCPFDKYHCVAEVQDVLGGSSRASFRVERQHVKSWQDSVNFQDAILRAWLKALPSLNFEALKTCGPYDDGSQLTPNVSYGSRIKREGYSGPRAGIVNKFDLLLVLDSYHWSSIFRRRQNGVICCEVYLVAQRSERIKGQ